MWLSMSSLTRVLIRDTVSLVLVNVVIAVLLDAFGKVRLLPEQTIRETMHSWMPSHRPAQGHHSETIAWVLGSARGACRLCFGSGRRRAENLDPMPLSGLSPEISQKEGQREQKVLCALSLCSQKTHGGCTSDALANLCHTQKLAQFLSSCSDLVDFQQRVDEIWLDVVAKGQISKFATGDCHMTVKQVVVCLNSRRHSFATKDHVKVSTSLTMARNCISMLAV